MKVRFELPVVQYDLITVVADVDTENLSMSQRRLLELLQNKERQLTSFELYSIQQMLIFDVASFSDAAEEAKERKKGSEWSFSDAFFDYDRTAESFEVIE